MPNEKVVITISEDGGSVRVVYHEGNATHWAEGTTNELLAGVESTDVAERLRIDAWGAFVERYGAGRVEQMDPQPLVDLVAQWLVDDYLAELKP